MGDDEEFNEFASVFDMVNLSLSLPSSRNSIQGSTGAPTRPDPHNNKQAIQEEDEDGVELSLGLSLGGRFGVDRTAASKLVRSTSVATYLPASTKDVAGPPQAPPLGPTQLGLVWVPFSGTSSFNPWLPQPPAYDISYRVSTVRMEIQEEWKKRKQLESLKRSEAKRRRLEKQRNTRESGVGSSRNRPRRGRKKSSAGSQSGVSR